MKDILIRLFTYALAMYLTAHLVNGLYFDTFWSLIAGAAVLSIINAVIRPIFMVLTFPVNVMTIGLFTFVVNGLMLKITSFLVPGMAVGGFWVATFAALILTVLSSLISWLVSD
jgi:putative membrane protein